MIRKIRWLPWLFVGIYYFLVGIGTVLQVRTGTSFAEMGMPIPFLTGFYIILGLWVIFGALIVRQNLHHPVGWIICAGLLTPAIDMFAFGIVSESLRHPLKSLPLVQAALVWLNWYGMAYGITIFTLIFLLSPDGKFMSARWRLVGMASLGAVALYQISRIFEPGPIGLYPSLANPFAVRATTWRIMGPFMWAAMILLVIAYLAGIASLVARIRRNKRDEARQVRWLIPPGLLFVLGIPITLLGEYGPSRDVFSLGGTIHMIAVTGMVAAITFSIFRHRLYDLEIIINRTLVYGSLTTALAIVYFATVTLLQRVFPSQSQAAVVISTFTIAALFSPLRRRVQAAIDRRFFRRRYDAAQIMTHFSGTVRNQVDLEALTRTLLELVEATMEPQSASLWLKSGEKAK